jgi:hypothetical protein
LIIPSRDSIDDRDFPNGGNCGDSGFHVSRLVGTAVNLSEWAVDQLGRSVPVDRRSRCRRRDETSRYA